MLPAINEISSQQARPTKETNNKATMLMNYPHNYMRDNLRYHVSYMHLYINSDAAYLILPNTRIRGAGYLCLSDKLKNTIVPPLPKMNGTILTECQTL